jgi:curved DNA-binding protein CbpA
MNWEEACQVLGVPVTATQTEIRAQYMYKAQLLHPDKTGGLPDQSRQKAEEELKIINSAYSVLKDPRNNTFSAPPKLKVSPKNIRFSDVKIGQPKTTKIRIESVGGSYTKFWMADSPAPWLRIVEAKSTTNDPLPLEVTVEATGTGTSQKNWQCSLPVRLENEKTKTRDEIIVKLEMQEGKEDLISDSGLNYKPKTRKFSFSENYKTIIFLLLPPIAGLVVYFFLKSFIPFWILLSFTGIYLMEKWFSHPSRKHKRSGVLYRILLNLGILFYLGFVIWSLVKLFSHTFMNTATIGSIVFLGELVFLIWFWIIVGRNSWRWPSMKLTLLALIVIFIVFSFAGVQPMAGYKDIALSHLSSIFKSPSTQ